MNAELPKLTYPSHKDMCEMFEVPVNAPAPYWMPCAVQKTVIEVKVNGDRRCLFGGAMECGACGFGLSMIPTETTCPPARQDGGCPKCGALKPEKEGSK